MGVHVHVHVMEIGIKMGKCVILTIRGCFRSVCNHPFLVGMLCFLIFMYRSSPFMFSLLVSASPVLVCTAVLLGTLLSFGYANVETKLGTTLKSQVLRDDDVVEQSESCSKVESNEGKERSPPEIELGELSEQQKDELKEERLSDGEVVESQYASTNDVGSEDEKSRADSFDSERVNVDSLDSPPQSPWKRVEDREDDEDADEDGQEREEEDDALESVSDGAESSSPDASMADIMPMLDELHPLLDEDAPQPVQTSHYGSDAVSVQSLESSSSSSSESDLEIENQEDMEATDHDKEVQMKPAIIWTEEDQKNLNDLGTLEIERNQRLEHLMLRRKARKHMSMVPEINLIDLESSDPPFNIAPISTARQNPFDLPNDNYDHLGLPPIPGSAPSILLPRRNPFDIPYDSGEDKPGDGLQEELIGLQAREVPFFRRHESFSVGPSIFGPIRQEKHDNIRLRPYFVPDRMASEESSYSPFHRQSSEVSDSRLSSVNETESVGSVDEVGVEELEEVTIEPELISEMKHVAEHIGHGSQSSEEEEEDSSSSSMSEGSTRVFSETEGTTLDVRRDVLAEEQETSVESNDIPHKEPVYDSSPPRGSKNISSSSSFSDVHAESDLGLPPVLVKRMVSFTERDSEGKEIEKAILSNDEMLPEPSTHSNIDKSDEKKPLVVSLRENLLVKKAPFKKREAEIVRSPDSDADDFHEANEKLIVTPSAGGSTPLFYDVVMHEPEYEHVEEVQVPNTPVESFERVQSIQNLNIPEIPGFDHDISSNINSADFIRTEEADEIKEIDEGLLSELDNVGDFSVTQAQSDEFERHIHSVEESLSSAQSSSTTIHATADETVSKENESKTATPVGTEVMNTSADVGHQSRADTDKPAILETPQAEPLVDQTKNKHRTPTHEQPVLEVRSVEDGNVDHKQVDETQNVVDSKETRGEGTSSPPEKVMDDNTEKELKQPILEARSDDGNVDHKQVDDIPPVVDSKETRGEGTIISPPEKVIDNNTGENQGEGTSSPSTSHVKRKGKKSKTSSSSDTDRE